MLSYENGYICHETKGHTCTSLADGSFNVTLRCAPLQYVTLVGDGQQPMRCQPMKSKSGTNTFNMQIRLDVLYYEGYFFNFIVMHCFFKFIFSKKFFGKFTKFSRQHIFSFPTLCICNEILWKENVSKNCFVVVIRY